MATASTLPLLLVPRLISPRPAAPHFHSPSPTSLLLRPSCRPPAEGRPPRPAPWRLLLQQLLRCRRNRRRGGSRSKGLAALSLVDGRQPCALRRFGPARVRRCAAALGHGRQELRTSEYQFDDDEPLWLAVVREIAVGFRGLVAFLAEQPRQLKHLEWPGFRNTLRTAALTLVLVALFIVALSSVDAALCYILSWLLRKSA